MQFTCVLTTYLGPLSYIRLPSDGPLGVPSDSWVLQLTPGQFEQSSFSIRDQIASQAPLQEQLLPDGSLTLP